MTEQYWIIIVGALIGIIVGGAGGAVLFRRAAGAVLPGVEVAETAAVVAATASSTAAVVAATASSVAAALRTELSGQITAIQSQIADNSDKLNELHVAINGFMSVCPERHRAIDHRLNTIDRAQGRKDV